MFSESGILALQLLANSYELVVCKTVHVIAAYGTKEWKTLACILEVVSFAAANSIPQKQPVLPELELLL